MNATNRPFWLMSNGALDLSGSGEVVPVDRSATRLPTPHTKHVTSRDRSSRLNLTGKPSATFTRLPDTRSQTYVDVRLPRNIGGRFTCVNATYRPVALSIGLLTSW